MIETFIDVLEHLYRKELVYTISDHKPCFYTLKNDQIFVYQDQVHYYLDLNDFKELYKDQTFYLYDKENKDENISLEKDEEYYSWTHK